MDMVTTVLDNGKLVKPSILTDEDKDNNGISDLGEFYQVKKTDTAGKVSVSGTAEDWTKDLVPVRKSEKQSFIINGLDTRTLCTIIEANKIADKKIDEFSKKLTDNKTVDTFKELVDYAAKHQGETLNIFATLDEHAEQIKDVNERLDQEIADRIQAVADEEAARIAADDALNQRVDETNARLDQEIADRTAADDALNQRVDETNARLDQEIADRKQAIADEADARTKADNALTKALNKETEDRIAADDVLTSNLNKEIEDRIAAVTAEETARIKADKVLTTNLNKEIANREKAVAEEKTARIKADDVLTAAIADEKAERIATIEAEATAREEEDTKLDNKINTEIDNRKKAVAAEEAARIAADDVLTENLNKEIADRIQAIEDEEAARIEADNTLQDNIDAEEAARIQAIEDEATARTTADNVLQENLDAEIAARKAAILEEETARKAADTVLDGKITDEATARKAAINAEAKTRSEEDTKLLAKFDDYYTSEETDDAIDTAIENYKDAKFKTVELTPEEIKYSWKAGVKLGELTDGNKNLLLFKKSVTNDKMSFIGGELLIEMDDGEHIDYHNISLTSTGVSSYDGSSDGLLDTSLFQCRVGNDKYYGVSIPDLKYREDSTFATANVDSRVGFRIIGPQDYQWSLGLGNGNPSEDTYSTVGPMSWAHCNWSYIKTSTLCTFLKIPYAAVKDSCLGKFYDGYVFFNVKYDASRQVGGIRDIVAAPELEYEPFERNGNTYYNVANSVSLLDEPYKSIFNWNSNYIGAGIDVANINKGTSADSNGWYSHTSSSFCRYIETIRYEVLGELKEKKITSAKFFFNGWFKEDDDLKPPVSYTDNDIYDIVYLNDEDTTGTVIKNATGEIISPEELPEEEKEILESPYKTLEIKTASGNVLTTSVINSSNTFTDLCETVDLQDVVTEGQALLAGINFHLLPLKNKMVITENSLIYVLSKLDATFGALNCQCGIYKLISKNGRNYLKVIATTNKETVAHDALNYFTGANPALKIVNIKETLLNPSKNFYYVGVLGGYRADMLGNNYWIGGVGNKAPASAYHHEFTNFNYYQHNLNDNDLQEIECNSVNAQVNYIRVVSGE